jgi:hypothetical protein
MISKMYDRGDLSANIMAQAFDQNWTPAQALKAMGTVRSLETGVDGKPNIPGYPTMPSHRKDEPNGDMIMAAAFLMEHGDFQPKDFDGKATPNSVLRLDERTIDAATSGEYRGVKFSDLCAHAAESFYEKSPQRHRLLSRRGQDYYAACVKAQQTIDERLDSHYYGDDIRADADTGLSTIGLKNIWMVINTATIGKAYQDVPTVWQRICKQASVSNFLKHTVHRTDMVGRFQRLVQVGTEPPHASFAEDMTETQIDEWGLMVALSRKDIINDEIGVFMEIPKQLGRIAAYTLEEECFAALLEDGKHLFKADHKNYLAGVDSAFSFKALDAVFNMIRRQTDAKTKKKIMVRPSFLLVPTTMKISAERLLSMGTMDGSPKGQRNFYQDFPVIDSPYLEKENGLFIGNGSNQTAIPGNDDGWYLFADPNIMPVIVATFLNGKTSPTVERGKMRFSLDGIQYKAIMDFEFVTSEHKGGVYSKGKA